LSKERNVYRELQALRKVKWMRLFAWNSN
jgi:hypothetical protein